MHLKPVAGCIVSSNDTYGVVASNRCAENQNTETIAIIAQKAMFPCQIGRGNMTLLGTQQKFWCRLKDLNLQRPLRGSDFTGRRSHNRICLTCVILRSGLLDSTQPKGEYARAQSRTWKDVEQSPPYKWRRVGELNTHPEGATGFRPVCLTVGGTLQTWR